MGNDRYYKEFLCSLFFEGFAKPEAERSREVHHLVGKIPYLNGGIFQKHQIETLHGRAIQIPDTAFEKIFGFFERYDWHLDDRPLQNDNEINPDVLGYIFEKYINQKQMGAYYTKEDITEYISKNTIIPFLFDAARTACQIAFEGETPLSGNCLQGMIQTVTSTMRSKRGSKLELLSNILRQGLRMYPNAQAWNTPAPDEYALPTEIWREVVARRGRYESILCQALKRRE